MLLKTLKQLECIESHFLQNAHLEQGIEMIHAVTMKQ